MGAAGPTITAFAASCQRSEPGGEFRRASPRDCPRRAQARDGKASAGAGHAARRPRGVEAECSPAMRRLRYAGRALRRGHRQSATTPIREVSQPLMARLGGGEERLTPAPRDTGEARDGPPHAKLWFSGQRCSAGKCAAAETRQTRSAEVSLFFRCLKCKQEGRTPPAPPSWGSRFPTWARVSRGTMARATLGTCSSRSTC